ncbi:MAG: carbamoyltransferase HypF, partial [Planctomycetales bacterium]
REVATPGNRRADYPLISCTDCGPRYTIIEAMPYERSRTSLGRFELCERCRQEYAHPADRRFHAQTIGCSDCGPHIWCSDRSGRIVADRHAALAAATRLVRDGGILALRGIGGYQLVCDATNEATVARLRARKGRPTKPLAVMVGSLAEGERLAYVEAAGREALISLGNPIVLLPVRPGNGLSPGIHPGLATVGLLLPTTAVHALLLAACQRPLVVTSGNSEGEPLAVDEGPALERLQEIADLWLHHDRPIVHPVDDSVVRIIGGTAVTIRLARGLAPLPLVLPAGPVALAVGGHQKAALALSNGTQSILGGHVGDLEGIATRERWIDQASALATLYGADLTHARWLHDAHPDYFTTRWAQERSGGRALAIQHHHAHVVAGMLEQGWLDREVLGVAFDGTGFGPEGTIWGGEFLLATASQFRRVAHLAEFRMAGGTAAIREPGRVALALVRESQGETAWPSGYTAAMRKDAAPLERLLKSPRWSPRTTSAGRLFDGVAALTLGIDRAAYEGEPAMRLEGICDRNAAGSYRLNVVEGNPRQIDWRPMIGELLDDLARGETPGAVSQRFHRGLAVAIATVCRQFAPLPVVLTGGVFQNQVLTELVLEEMTGSNQLVGLPGTIPPNDGGLAAGQLAVGLARMTEEGKCG